MIINLNDRYQDDLDNSLAKIEGIIQDSLTGDRLTVVFLPPKHPRTHSTYFPADCISKEVKQDIKKRSGQDVLSAPLLLIRNWPRWSQVVVPLLHEYRHFWQHEQLSPGLIEESNRQKWIARCSICATNDAFLEVPLETDAEVYAYHGMQQFFDDWKPQRRADVIFGITIDDPFFKLGHHKLPLLDKKGLERAIRAHSRLVAKQVPFHERHVHQATPGPLFIKPHSERLHNPAII